MKYEIGDKVIDEDGHKGIVCIRYDDGDICFWENDAAHPNPQISGSVLHTCHNCEHLSDRHHELDPLGEWKWCELWGKDVLEDSYSCKRWEKVQLTYPEKEDKS